FNQVLSKLGPMMILILGELSLLRLLKYSISWTTVMNQIYINSGHWYYELCFFDNFDYTFLKNLLLPNCSSSSLDILNQIQLSTFEIRAYDDTNSW
ncbi:7519_t:CDS:2, partial [Dentiscutata erythropus]